MVIHLFVSETIVAAAMYTRIKQGGRVHMQRVSYQVLFNQVSFLSQLFRGEFVFPTEGIVKNLRETLQGLEADRIIKITYKLPCSGESEHEIDYVELTDEERKCGRENYDFYCFLVWPFIESAWLAGVSILALTPPVGLEDVWLDAKQAQDMAQLVKMLFFFFLCLSHVDNLFLRLAKLFTTKEISPISKQSIKKLLKTPFSVSKKTASSYRADREAAKPQHCLSSRRNGCQNVIRYLEE
jgi:hypothetical protein